MILSLEGPATALANYVHDPPCIAIPAAIYRSAQRPGLERCPKEGSEECFLALSGRKRSTPSKNTPKALFSRALDVGLAPTAHWRIPPIAAGVPFPDATALPSPPFPSLFPPPPGSFCGGGGPGRVCHWGEGSQGVGGWGGGPSKGHFWPDGDPHLSETGRIRFRRVRFQTPSSVSFCCPHRVPRRELSEFLSAYYLSDKANSPSFSQNSPSLPQNSVRLSEFSSPKQYSRNSIPPVSYFGGARSSLRFPALASGHSCCKMQCSQLISQHSSCAKKAREEIQHWGPQDPPP